MAEAINYTELLDEFDNDHELINEIIEMFLEDMNSTIKQLRLDVAAADSEQIRQHAHKLKGSAVNVGAEGVQLAAQRLENIGQNQQVSDAAAALNELEHQAEITNAYAANHTAD